MMLYDFGNFIFFVWQDIYKICHTTVIVCSAMASDSCECRLKCAVLLYQIDLLRLTYQAGDLSCSIFFKHAVGFNQPQPIC